MKLEIFPYELIPLIVSTLLMAICQHFEWLQGQILVFWAFLAIIAYISLTFISNTVQQLSTYLGIYCFSLEKRPKLEDL